MTNDTPRFMQRTTSALLVLACCALFVSAARAQGGETVDTLTTKGGPLTLVRFGQPVDMKMELRLNGRKLLDVEDMYASFVAHFRGLGNDREAVVLTTSEGGNACPALFRIIAVEASGQASVTDEFGDCSDSPTITLQQLPTEQILLRFPGFYRLSEASEPGFRKPPPTTWVYSKGVLREQTPAAPARRRK